MNKTFVASTVALLMPLSACATTDADTEKSESRLTREQQAAKTEVWEPVPEVVSFDKAGVPSDAISLIGDDLSNWTSVKEGDAKW
ncbi:MAG: DUF1080 domain-containing protein, partial [Pseudomonadota bacterium]|nr:DUF1080 domain-containing protein [Pseudomonadota bacterium]